MTQDNTRCPSEAFLRAIDIRTLLPQQVPFVMVGRLAGFSETATVTETTIAAGNLFVENGCFSCSGIMENIAQTCAARIGYVNKYILKKGIQIGFIGAVRGFNVMELPKVGDTITTTVEIVEEVFGMTLANARVACGDKTLATTQMKIAVKKGEI